MDSKRSVELSLRHLKDLDFGKIPEKQNEVRSMNTLEEVFVAGC